MHGWEEENQHSVYANKAEKFAAAFTLVQKGSMDGLKEKEKEEEEKDDDDHGEEKDAMDASAPEKKKKTKKKKKKKSGGGGGDSDRPRCPATSKDGRQRDEKPIERKKKK